MDTIEEIKKQIKSNIKWGRNNLKTGGQTTGVFDPTVVLTSEELDLKIEIGYYNSQMENKELAFTLFCLTLDELIN